MTKTKQRQAVKLAVRQNKDFLDRAARTQHDLETQVGNTERKRRIEISSVLFLKTLIEQCEGTFVWEGPRQGEQHANIFEALAARMPAYLGLGLRAKNDHIEEYGPKLRQGFNGARKWLAEWFTATVYCVPQNNEASIQTVLTLNPRYRVECGRTAAEMQAQRDYKLAYGQMKATAMRVVASSGDEQANNLLGKIMEQVMLDVESELDERQQLQTARATLQIESR